jgi:hypothetical protein
MTYRTRRETQVTTGLRSPDQSPARLGMAVTDGREPATAEENAVGLSPAHLDPPDPNRKKFRFRSRNLNHMVLLQAFTDDRLPDGRVIKGKTVHAKFKDGYFETENPEFAKRLRENRNFGLEGGDYWDADEQDHVSAIAVEDAFKSGLRRDPLQRAAFRKAMAAGDFDDILNGRDERDAVVES